MSKVELVPNKKASAVAGHPVYHVKSSTGNSYSVQVSSTVDAEVRPGLITTQNRIGFARFTNEATCLAFIAKAAANGYMLPGKVVYQDQLTPIMADNTEYGKHYPYLMSINGKAIGDFNQRIAIAKSCIDAELTLQAPDADGVMQTIYRSKVYTELMDTPDSTIQAKNMDEVIAFVSKLVSAPASGTDKAARIAQLQSIAKAKRTQAEKLELADLVEA